jgi:hypothetical protein
VIIDWDYDRKIRSHVYAIKLYLSQHISGTLPYMPRLGT